MGSVLSPEAAVNSSSSLALVHAKGISLDYWAIPGGASGVSEGGAITVRPDLEPAEEFAVLVHELAHELLYKGERRSETSKKVRETEAEAVSFVVSQAIGLDCSSRSSDYIQLYRGDKDTLGESLGYIQNLLLRSSRGSRKLRKRAFHWLPAFRARSLFLRSHERLFFNAKAIPRRSHPCGQSVVRRKYILSRAKSRCPRESLHSSTSFQTC